MRLNEAYQAALPQLREGLKSCKPSLGGYYLMIAALMPESAPRCAAMQSVGGDTSPARATFRYPMHSSAVLERKQKAQTISAVFAREGLEKSFYLHTQFDENFLTLLRLAQRCMQKQITYAQLAQWAKEKMPLEQKIAAYPKPDDMTRREILLTFGGLLGMGVGGVKGVLDRYEACEGELLKMINANRPDGAEASIRDAIPLMAASLVIGATGLSLTDARMDREKRRYTQQGQQPVSESTARIAAQLEHEVLPSINGYLEIVLKILEIKAQIAQNSPSLSSFPSRQ